MDKKEKLPESICRYESPLGEIMIAGREDGITGLWFEGQKYYARTLGKNPREHILPIFEEVKHWLDIYFAGKEPDFMPSLLPEGSQFRQMVWKILCEIPYGETAAYKEIAEKVAEMQGVSHMSAQAVGGAVGHNPISILIPCHRVLGTDGSLTGYAGGVEKKKHLLMLESKENNLRKAGYYGK